LFVGLQNIFDIREIQDDFYVTHLQYRRTLAGACPAPMWLNGLAITTSMGQFGFIASSDQHPSQGRGIFYVFKTMSSKRWVLCCHVSQGIEEEEGAPPARCKASQAPIALAKFSGCNPEK
jgi:hypothetical protein